MTNTSRLLILSCFILVTAVPAVAQNAHELAPVSAYAPQEQNLPPSQRYQAWVFVPTEPEAFFNESDENGYPSGRGENPRSN